MVDDAYWKTVGDPEMLTKVKSWLATGPKKVGPFTVSLRLYVAAVLQRDIAVVTEILKAASIHVPT